LHCWQIEGFFNNKTPVINLEAGVVGMEYMLEDFNIENLDDLVVVSPDAGGVGRAKKFQEFLIARGFPGVSLAMIIKQRAGAGKISKMDLVGSVEGKDCIIIDDMIDTAGTLCKAAAELKDFGAKKVYAFATHGVFTNPAPQRIRDSVLEKVLITNTVPLSQDFIDMVPQEMYVQLSIGTFIAEVIRRIYLKESVSGMYGPLNYRQY
jgi:ribose-phosphate pyrophosphokinase